MFLTSREKWLPWIPGAWSVENGLQRGHKSLLQRVLIRLGHGREKGEENAQHVPEIHEQIFVI